MNINKLAQFIRNHSIISEVAFCVIACFLSSTLFKIVKLYSPLYNEASVFNSLFLSFPILTKGGALISVVVLCAIAYLSIKKTIHWASIGRLNRVIWASLIILTWSFGFTSYNYFINHWGLVDRILLICFCLGSIINPYLIILVFFQSLFLANQFDFPKCFDFTFTDKKIIFDIIVTAWLFFIAKSTFIKNLNTRVVFLLILAIISQWYFQAGIGKALLEWDKTNDLYYLFASCIDHGWLDFVPTPMLYFMAEQISSSKVFINYSTFFVELAIPTILVFNRRLSIIALISYAIFHLIVFTTSGIFFWKWIVIEIVLVLVISKSNNWYENKIKNYVIYFVSIFACILFNNTTRLSWLDSGLFNSFTVEIVDYDNHAVKLNSSFFEPYDINFSQNRFNFLFQDKVISGTFGSTMDKHLLSILNGMRVNNSVSPDRIFDYINKHGISKYNEKKKVDFKLFLQEFIRNKQKQDYKQLNDFSPPYHIWQNSKPFEGRLPKEILNIRVIKQTKMVLPNLDYLTLDTDTVNIKPLK